MIGLFGKLPAHGDFVRRGGPAAVLAALDRWLDAELSRAPALADRIDALDGWCFAATIADERVTGAMIASGDSVGRTFPLVATLSGGSSDRGWSGLAITALEAARDGGLRADDALAALPPPGTASQATGWWHMDGRKLPDTGLPTGDAFARLFEREGAA